jgi:hypothetical protein
MQFFPNYLITMTAHIAQTAITEPDRYTDEQGVDDVDEEDSADEQ